jgi:hypothetical protein
MEPVSQHCKKIKSAKVTNNVRTAFTVTVFVNSTGQRVLMHVLVDSIISAKALTQTAPRNVGKLMK